MEDRQYPSRSKLTWLEHPLIVRDPRSVRSGIEFIHTHARHRPVKVYKTLHLIDMESHSADVKAHTVLNLLVTQNTKHGNEMPAAQCATRMVETPWQ